jgi:hypothetical protein
MATRRSERGVALIIAVIVVLVVTILAVGVIRYASREVAGANAGRKAAAIASCAEAARSMLMSRWRLGGEKAGPNLAPLDEQIESTGPTTLLGGHYGDVSVSGVQVVRINDLTTGAALSSNDLTNRIGDTVANYRVVVHCVQGTPPDARELEVEFAVNYGL